MKYYPYAGLEATSFKPLLKAARVLGVLSIAGIFISLIIAAIGYINFDPNQLPMTQTAKSVANSILISGISISFLSFCISGLLAWLVTFANSKEIDITIKKVTNANLTSSAPITAELACEPC
jgi:hypothetical protein